METRQLHNNYSEADKTGVNLQALLLWVAHSPMKSRINAIIPIRVPMILHISARKENVIGTHLLEKIISHERVLLKSLLFYKRRMQEQLSVLSKPMRVHFDWVSRLTMGAGFHH